MLVHVSRACSLILLASVTAVGCNGGDDTSANVEESTSAIEAAPTTERPEVAQFCAAMQQLTSSTPTAQQLDELIATARDNMPPEIQEDAHRFLANLRVVNDAFTATGEIADDVALERVLNTLTLEQRLFIEDLANAQQTGVPPDNATGRVITYVATGCA